MKLDLCICEALSYMHVTMETTFVGMAINYHALINLEYIAKCKTEDDGCSLPNLLYKFN